MAKNIQWNCKGDPNQVVGYDSVIETVNELLPEGITRSASDIHLEPAEEGLAIRLRIDGMLYSYRAFPGDNAHDYFPAKIMAEMDIAEKRLPQDGNIYLHNNNQN